MKQSILRGLPATTLVCAATSFGASAQTFNPTAAAQGFNVFTTGAVTIVGGDTHGPLAVGGNLVLAGNAPLVMNTSGMYPTGTLNSANNYGLVINGRVFYNSGGSPTYVNNGLVRLSNSTGTTPYDQQNNTTTNLQLTSGAFGSSPRVEKQNGWQDKNTVANAHGINFTTAATQIAQASAIINSYATTNCQSQINIIAVPTCNSCNPQLPLVNGKVNFMNITTQTQLNDLLSVGSLNMMSAGGVKPSATSPMIFNITIPGAVTFAVPNMSSVGGSDGPYILWNFRNATSIGFGGGTYNNSVYGTILAPQASLVKDGGNNFEGQVLTASFSLNTGEVHYQPFAALLPQCSTPLALENISISATRLGADVRVGWKADRVSNVSLDLERSVDGEHWITVAADLRGLDFVDASAPQSRLQYRLHAQSAEGAVRYSSTASIAALDIAASPTVAPNPFANAVVVAGMEEATTAVLTDAAGRVIATQAAAGGAARFAGLDALSSGLYFIRVTTAGGGTTVHKLVKQ